MAEEKTILFRVAQPEQIRVKLDLEQDGVTIPTVHTFRAPTARDKKEYYAHASYTELVNGAQRQINNAPEASETLYDACIQQVTGMDFAGIADWKAAVPVEVKKWACNMLLGQFGLGGAEVLKN